MIDQTTDGNIGTWGEVGLRSRLLPVRAQGRLMGSYRDNADSLDATHGRG